jgi:hypothetical protein
MMIPQEQSNFLQTLIDSKKLPGHVKSVQDAFTIAQMGKELGFPTMQAFHYIVPIQGKLSLSAKAIGAILRRRGITMQTLEDGLYVYKDGSTSPFATKGEEANPEKAVDRRTTIRFTRDGIAEDVAFTWVDATKQDLTSKDNWKRMPKEMLWARCLSKGANRIAADLLLGLYSADEMYDTFAGAGLKVKRDEDGTISEIVTEDTDHEVVK